MNPMTEAPEALISFVVPNEEVVDASVTRGRPRLEALIAEQQPTPTARRPRPGRMLAAATALACAALIAGIVVGVRPGGPPERLAAVEAVAERVETLPDPTALGPRDHFYTDTRFWARVSMQDEGANGKPSKSKPWIQIENAQVETWISPQGGLRSKMTPEAIEASYPTAEDRRRAEAAASVVLGAPLPLIDDSHPERVFTVGDSHLDYAALRDLPTDPALLESELESLSQSGAGVGRTAATMRAAEALLQYPIRSEVRASIYRVIAGLPGITEKTGVADAMKRVGTSVTWSDGVYRRELVFDPNTGVDLELRLYELNPQKVDPASLLKPGELTERDTIVARGVVDRAEGVVLSKDYAARN